MKYDEKPISFLPDEPFFVIRAKDNYSVAVLNLLKNVYKIDDETIGNFVRWRADNPDKCKDPD